MSEKIIAIMGSLEGDLKRLAYVGNKAAGSDRLWVVYGVSELNRRKTTLRQFTALRSPKNWAIWGPFN